MPNDDRNFIQNSTKDKIDKAAYAKALIVRGEYDWTGTEWEGKKLPRHKDGTYRAPVKVLLKEGGWAESNTTALKNLSCAYFNERFHYHMQRLDGGFRQALAEITGDGKALELLSTKLYESLMADLQDEERARRIPFKDRANLYQTLTEMDAKLKGDSASRNRQGPSIGGIVQVINNNVGDSPEGRQMLSDLAHVHEDVLDIVEGVVEVADSDG
jgi:hypothetical protein